MPSFSAIGSAAYRPEPRSSAARSWHCPTGLSHSPGCARCRLGRRPLLLLHEAGGLQVVAGNVGGVLLVDVDPSVQLLHYLQRKVLLDLLNHVAEIRVGR